ncbi:hypothetical protein [Mycobacterium sp. SM1]|uniref:hypothetical protein n=1 Tax=Mycobacterium sp. SM1 TaxID=2816243 RepID=UPI0027DE5676|nr:hypothetical protein [Mycobacterium sp. SM1]
MRFADAALVRERVEGYARRLRLRGAANHVLSAVLALLCGWSRITDDQIRLTQVVELIVATAGRRYDLKTIGRALARLAALDLIVYQPARGRGRRAFMAIHDQFIHDIAVLDRDSSGRVITSGKSQGDTNPVTFSTASPYKSQYNYLPTLHDEAQPATARPTAVDVSTQELQAVLHELPKPMAELPRHLRWLLGGEIRQRLLAGWRPDQILEVLSAPLPQHVERPWRLALWRLRHNIVGVGPRLRPLQQAWDDQATAQAKAAAAEITARWYNSVAAVTSTDERAELLRAHQVKFGEPAADPVAALAGAGRRVARMFPGMPLAAALARWVAEVLGPQPEEVAGQPVAEGATRHTDLLTDLAIAGCQCVVCGSQEAIARPQLPLKSVVCDRCWQVIASEMDANNSGADKRAVA